MLATALRHMVRRVVLTLITVPMLFVASSPVNATPRFRSPYLILETGGSPTSVAIADLNTDGKQDMVVTDGGSYSPSNTISVMLGNGDATFVRTDIAVATGPRSVRIADLDHDGRLDIALVNHRYESDLGTISILLGNGDGTFGTRTDFDGGRDLIDFEIADLNGDTHPDLVTDRSVLLGNGDGTFQARVEFTSYDRSLAVADLDRDGRVDVVTVDPYIDFRDEREDAVALRLGNGDGTLAPPVRFGVGSRPSSVKIGDVNGDQKLDIAVTNYGLYPDHDGSVSIFLGDGAGDFEFRGYFETGRNPSSMAIRDFNGDGLIDLATANLGEDPDYDSNTVSILPGNGDGTFRAHVDFPVESDPRSIDVADFDGNGILDIVTLHRSSNCLSLLLGNGGGTFGGETFQTVRHPSSIAADDINADGMPDLAVTSRSEYTGRVYLGNGDGTFGRPFAFVTGRDPDAIAIADFNGDATPDIAMVNHGSESVSLLMGNGNGTFQDKSDFGAGPTPSGLVIADLNADGFPDVVVANGPGAFTEEPGTVSVLLGKGDGTLGLRQEFVTGAAPLAVAIADLNEDGRLDLMSANYVNPNSVSVLLGVGDGTFRTPTHFSNLDLHQVNDVYAIAVADLNEDGHVDVLAGKTVYLGAGDGSLNAVTQIRGYFQGMAVADFDADGHLDVATADIGEAVGDFWIHSGNGDGTFANRIRIGAGHNPYGLAIADFNADERPDIAVTTLGTRSIAVLLNDSDDVTTPTLLSLFEAVWSDEGIELRWRWGVPVSLVEARLQRSLEQDGPWSPVVGELRTIGETTHLLDRSVASGMTYFYRLIATRQDGAVMTSEPISVASPVIPGTVNLSVSPNPTRNFARLDFQVAREGRVHLSVHDVQGRQVSVLAEGVFPPGRHQAIWNEKERIPPGVYLVRYEAPGIRTVMRVLLIP